MSTFPPKKANQAPVQPSHVVEKGAVSTGNGGIPKSLQVKAAGNKNAPGLEKNVNAF